MSEKPTYEALEKRIRELEQAEFERKRAAEAMVGHVVDLQTTTDNAEEIKFEDLFDLEDIQRFQDDFAGATGVGVLLTHEDGTPITQPSNFCRLCNDIVRKTEKGCANCYKSDAELGRSSPGGILIRPCLSAGLWGAGAGISVGGRHIANWLIGQVRDETQTEDAMRAYARKIGVDEAEMVDAFLEVPSISREQFKKIAQFFFTLAQQLSNTAYQNVQQARLIIERQKAEKALRESEEKYRMAFQASPDSVTITSMEDGRYLEVNDGFCSMTGYSKKEAIGRTSLGLNMFVNTHDRREIVEKLKKDGEVVSLEIQQRKKDDTIYEILFSAKPVRHANKNCLLAVVKDISQLKQAAREKNKFEKQFQHAQKMEAVGTLAGGIAHDFNNLLMGIQGRVSLTLMDRGSSHPDFEHLIGIEELVKKASDLTKQLLGYARGGKFEVKTTDMNNLIQKSISLFGRTKKEITVHTEFKEAVWPVDVDRGQIEQVLMNLYINAWHAMPGGGDLYLGAKNEFVGEKYVKPFKVEPGKYVKISVTDTGAGMDKPTLEKIFEPFFTTKEMGRGTGLGLASAYGIVKNHGGFINAYSEKGHGTTFNFYLPASKKEVSVEKQSVQRLLKGSETVLLIDDEDVIIDVGKPLLERLGYKVLTAKNGQNAIQILEENKQLIDMVILDMVMPNMGGDRTYDRMKEIDPDIKVLLSSGYSINGRATEILNRGCNGFIQKPFGITELSIKLREILEKKNT